MKKLFLCIFFFSAIAVNAQLRGGIESNAQYYVDDNKIKLEENERDERFRSNTYLKLDYSLKNFEFGIQGEAYYPKPLLNYNPLLQDFNIGTLYARYNNYEKGIDVTVGHLYEQFGSGLALRFWEDRALGINNALFGSRVNVRIGDIAQLKVLG